MIYTQGFKKKNHLMTFLLRLQVNSIDLSLTEAAKAALFKAAGRWLHSAQLKGAHK